MLKIAEEALRIIREHGEEGFPFEICGFLVGTVDGETRVAREAWPVRNSWEEDPEQRAKLVASLSAGAERWEEHSEERRFLVSPQETVGAMKRAREAGLDLVGLYHTHPNHPAVPSDFDRDLAWPDWSYVIVSVREGKVAEERSWVVLDPDDPFTEEAVEVVG